MYNKRTNLNSSTLESHLAWNNRAKLSTLVIASLTKPIYETERNTMKEREGGRNKVMYGSGGGREERRHLHGWVGWDGEMDGAREGWMDKRKGGQKGKLGACADKGMG